MRPDPIHYADFCSQTQTEFLAMGCADRRASSDQCILRALDYASFCACDRRNCADHRTISEYSALGAFVAVGAFAGAVMLGCLVRHALRCVCGARRGRPVNVSVSAPRPRNPSRPELAPKEDALSGFLQEESRPLHIEFRTDARGQDTVGVALLGRTHGR